MTYLRWIVVGLGLCFVLSACTGAPAAVRSLEAPLAPLPSVTPVQTTSPRPAAVAIALPTAQTVVPTTTPQATVTPGIVLTADGPVTASMAQLNLSAEPYATLGDPNAPITVVEFADFGCEFCGRFHLLTFGAIKAEYIDTGKIYYVYKDLPVTSQHGALAAQAAECAGVQGQYWAMHAALFTEPRAWYGSAAGAQAQVQAAAVEVDLDIGELEACIADGSQTPNIDRNFAEAQALRIYGTPAFFINAKLLAGAHSADVWREILDGELAALTAN